MASLFKGYNRDIKYLLPPSVTDWLQAGHLAYFVSDIVDKLDLSEIKNMGMQLTGPPTIYSIFY